MIISIIIPTYNEEKVIKNCLQSLEKQTLKNLEIIVVDDGSTDNTWKILSEFKMNYSAVNCGASLQVSSSVNHSSPRQGGRYSGSRINNMNLRILKQRHKGPGAARNLGSKYAKGNILVFVDSDMEFEPDFIEKLIKPIKNKQTLGTFSKEEYLLNKENIWAKLWNLNLGRDENKMHSNNYPDFQPVFRAILKNKFDEIGGFDENIGYTDDWSLSRKLNDLAKIAKGAIFYHQNPESLKEVWEQARWFGKNEFLTGNFERKLYNFFRFNPIISLLKGFYGWIKWGYPQFLIFKLIYDSAVFISVCLSFLGEKKYK